MPPGRVVDEHHAVQGLAPVDQEVRQSRALDRCGAGGEGHADLVREAETHHGAADIERCRTAEDVEADPGADAVSSDDGVVLAGGAIVEADADGDAVVLDRGWSGAGANQVTDRIEEPRL